MPTSQYTTSFANTADALSTLAEVQAEIDRRYALMSQIGIHRLPQSRDTSVLPDVKVVFIPSSAFTIEEHKRPNEAIFPALMRVITMGRAVGVQALIADTPMSELPLYFPELQKVGFGYQAFRDDADTN